MSSAIVIEAVRGVGLLLGALSGVMVAIALTTLWRAYTVSSIGVAAPLAAVVSTVIPVLVDTIRGEVPGVLGWLGVAAGLLALFLTSWSPSTRGVGLGIVLRGGAFAVDPVACRGTFRNWDYPIRRQIFSGFRCARDG